MEFYGDSDSEDLQRWPQNGNFKVEAHEKYVPLFTSAIWELYVTLNGRAFASTEKKYSSHSDEEISFFVRKSILENQKWLKRISVDVDENYRSWGGHITDLYEI